MKYLSRFLLILLFSLFYANIFLSQNHLYSLQLRLNDSVHLHTPILIQNNSIQIPAYTQAQSVTSAFNPENDSIQSPISIYENILLLKKINNHSYTGKWIKYSGNKQYSIPCNITTLQKHPPINRFLMNHFPQKWEIFLSSNTSSYKAIGNFQFYPDDILPHLSGSIATPYGDLGNLNGYIQNDTLYLSVFNGSFATQLIGKIFDHSTHIDSIKGWIYYGNWAIEKFTAIPNENFHINNQIPLNKIFADTNFIFKTQWKDIDNHIIHLEKNKPLIILIMGSWCPNCTDENKIFTEWYPNISSSVQIIAISVERTNDENKARSLLKKYKEKLNIPYPIVLLSANGNQPPFSLFPEIQKIPAFPTTLYFDKQHKIFKATIGFNGPATNELYLQTQQHIQHIIQQLMQ
ncbi:MAG: TlpA family protein disulfide reductase [Bacteroidetes bacterium]|nr:MAG: TlpA family protein disulfide reductase [Bacteroidota bacterium]